MSASDNSNFRRLPSIDKLLRAPELTSLLAHHGREVVRDAAREILERWRADIESGRAAAGADELGDGGLAELCREIATRVDAGSRRSLLPVFNLTGTVIHTNLGRALLPQEAVDAVTEAAGRAVNLEYDLAAGSRGDRDSHVEALICRHTGAEAATVVNNNAAAVVLVLTALAVGREVLISRGELVEIGGAFRIPEVMGSAGCRLREVGATNRTHRFDFERAINSDSALIMKVHTSNYEIQGFSQAVPEEELATLAHEHGLPFVVDLGSGTLLDLARYGLSREPTVADALSKGADLVTFSGDKLLGGPQAGIIAGSKDLVAKVKGSPLKRALRVDKLTLAALSAVLQLYNSPSTLAARLPILRDLTRPLAEIAAAAQTVQPVLARFLEGDATVAIASCKSQIGSGALPVDLLESVALEITPSGNEKSDRHLQELVSRFRSLPTPVIGRLHDGRLVFDLRCLQDVDEFCRQLVGT